MDYAFIVIAFVTGMGVGFLLGGRFGYDRACDDHRRDIHDLEDMVDNMYRAAKGHTKPGAL